MNTTNKALQAREHLYFTSAAYDNLLYAVRGEVDEETGEITQNFEAIMGEIMALEGEIPVQVAGASCVYLEEQADLDKMKAARARIDKLIKAKENGLDSLKLAIDKICRQSGYDKIEQLVDGNPVKISYRKSAKVEIDNEADIPDEYWRVKREVDKTAIKAAIKAGKQIGGAHIEESTNIQIK